MKLFLKRIFYFGFFISIFIIFISFLLPIIKSNEPKDKNAIYIWGDSQAYQGIDLILLNRKTNRICYSMATHGAGVYDFLIFTEKVPENSQVIMSLSKSAQIREKSTDYNRTGLSISSLYTLYKNNYSCNELYTIFNNNKLNNFTFCNNSELYPYNDTIVYREPLSTFIKGYKKVPIYLLDKQNIYMEGIKKLIAKKCKIIFVDFPFHSILKKIEDKSPIKIKTQNFNKKIFKLFNKVIIDTIQMSNHKQKMHDLTHLNALGAKEVSRILVNYLNGKTNKGNIIFSTIKV